MRWFQTTHNRLWGDDSLICIWCGALSTCLSTICRAPPTTYHSGYDQIFHRNKTNTFIAISTCYMSKSGRHLPRTNKFSASHWKCTAIRVSLLQLVADHLVSPLHVVRVFRPTHKAAATKSAVFRASRPDSEIVNENPPSIKSARQQLTHNML